jgi:hypothetical protein
MTHTEAQVHRYTISIHDWTQAERYAGEALKFPINEAAYEALIQMAIISYWRPFSPNEKDKASPAASRLDIQEFQPLAPEEIELHEQLGKLRNKAVAHSEVAFNPTQISDAVITSFQFSVHQIPQLEVLPNRLIALTRKFVERAHHVRANFMHQQRR